MSAAKSKTRRKQLGCALLLTVLAGADVLANAYWMTDGMLRGRPLPPFGAITNPGQRARTSEQPAPDHSVGNCGQGRFDGDLGWSNIESYVSGDGNATVNSIGARGCSSCGRTTSGLLASGQRYCQPFADELTAQGIPLIDLSLALEAEARSPDRPGLFLDGHLGNLTVAHAVSDWLAGP